ncbi:hypothetical protein E2562_027653 [Oryza meyeriana var. granulata]|uniref:Uncharacterized protein n=1 Tax=Oryza meyeriana var. granulata TaxID=110450 RepID=A0A6G1E2S7_9ORYZ|nr:hypothetical protein E2562_027653 [Oryza meyeriana var. granulata]
MGLCLGKPGPTPVASSSDLFCSPHRRVELGAGGSEMELGGGAGSGHKLAALLHLASPWIGPRTWSSVARRGRARQRSTDLPAGVLHRPDLL